MPTVAEYVAIRLQELGARHLFSIPGNYTAEFLLAANRVGITCIGTANELEAGFAADAYARYQPIGVCSATYGVGSQSLYSAITGAYVEFCPVVLVNGSPPTVKVADLKNRGILFAHAIDPIRTDELIFRPVTVATTVIDNPLNAPSEIDRVLRACITQSRPVYLEVHQGVWSMPCDPPGPPIVPIAPTPEEEQDMDAATDAAVSAVLERLGDASHPVLWGGEMLKRWRVVDQFEALVNTSGLPYTTTLMAKSLISETAFPAQFIGVYDSNFAPQRVKELVEGSDCLIGLGTIMSDFYRDIVLAAYDRMILAAGDAVRIGHAVYPNVPLARFMRRLVSRWGETAREFAQLPGLSGLQQARQSATSLTVRSTQPEPESKLTYQTFTDHLAEFLDKDMVLLLDTGLALFPSAEIRIERQAGYVAQTAWLSIGYTNGAALGVALSVADARPVVVTGDGGFQMTPQAFSTLARQKKPAIVFVMDNENYAIEQYLVDIQILPEHERFFQNRLPEPSFFDIVPA